MRYMVETTKHTAIECKDLNFAYQSLLVLQNISFSIQANSLCALVGPNGSGKSTLIKCITGLLTPNSGVVNIFDKNINDNDGRSEIKKIGYVEQRHQIKDDFPSSVYEVVSAARVTSNKSWFKLNKTDKEAIEHAIESVALKDFMHSSFHELSGGQQQRVLIAKAFAGEPKILILDEPTAGVDANSQELFKSALTHSIKEHNVTVLLVSHELTAVSQIVDQVIVLKNKILFDGPPSSLEEQGVSLGLHLHDLPIWLERIEEDKNV